MSPLRGWTVGENVGAPLVTPGADAAQRNPSANGIPPQMGTPASACPGESRPLSGRHECRPYGGGLRNTRGGATCDARCRNGTMEFVRKRNPVREWNYATNGEPRHPPTNGEHRHSPANGEPRHPPTNGEPRHPSALANPTRHPGDMNVAPTWADRGEKRLQRE